MNHDHLKKFAKIVEHNPSEALRLSFYFNQGINNIVLNSYLRIE